MRTKLLSPLGLSATGAGPKIFRTMLPALLIGIAVQSFFPVAAAFPYVQADTLKNIGWILLIPGILFWICSVVQFIIEFRKGKLITTGVYSLSRNPIYASWIVFILPGLAAIFNNWIFLLAAMIMYVALVRFISEEEKTLFETFGNDYTAYSKKVNRVLFFLPF